MLSKFVYKRPNLNPNNYCVLDIDEIFNIDGSTTSNFVWKVNENDNIETSHSNPEATVITGLSPSNAQKCSVNDCAITGSWPSKARIIDKYAFYRKRITSIPSSWSRLTKICDNAFESNKLTKLPRRWDNIREIGIKAFKNNKINFIGDLTWTTKQVTRYYKKVINGNQNFSYSSDEVDNYRGNIRKHTNDIYETCWNPDGENFWSFAIVVENTGDILSDSGECEIETVYEYSYTTHHIFENIVSIGDDAFLKNDLSEINTSIPGGKTSEQIGITRKFPKENIITEPDESEVAMIVFSFFYVPFHCAIFQ